MLQPSNYNGAQLTTPYSLSAASYNQPSNIAKPENSSSPPAATDYSTSGITHPGLLPASTSPNTIQTNSNMLAASATTPTAPTDTSTATASAHMSSYGGALASSSAYALGGPYSGYPYANLAGTATGAADVWGATNGSSAAYGATAGAYSSYAGGDYAGTTPFSGSYPPYYSEMNDGVRRKNATRESTNTLKAWLNEHKKNPYPTKGEKIMLAIITKMTLTQVSTWFANARRRLKKENKMTWVPKNRPENDDDENSDKDGEDKEDALGDGNTVSFGTDEDKDRIPTSRTYASPGVGVTPTGTSTNGPNTSSYASPVASLQTWVNGFAPPGSSESAGVKTEGGQTADSNNSPVNGEYAKASDGTSTNVSPLSSTLSNSIPYSGTVSASQIHPSYASTSTAYEATAAASYYQSAGYYHPSALTSMDPYSGYSTAGTTNPTNSAVPFAQKF